MDKKTICVSQGMPEQKSANTNKKPKIFTDAVVPEHIREIRSRCTDFVATMKSCGIDDYLLIDGFMKEIQRIALESDNVDTLVRHMRDYVRCWENYEHIDHDAK